MTSYNTICAISGNGQGLAMGSIDRPSEMFMLGESAGGSFWRPTNDTTGCDSGVLTTHNEGINVAYCDGHVKWMKSDRAHGPKAWVNGGYLPWANKSTTAPGW
ncbi:MAG: H-X9-DG-CTERM domain-containing protein [Armatimonadota bacterium]